MPLIPNDDPAALDELLGYLDEIGYGELYLGRPAAGAAPASVPAGSPGAAAGDAGGQGGAGSRSVGAGGAEAGGGGHGSADDTARAVAALAAAARDARQGGPLPAPASGAGTAAAGGVARNGAMDAEGEGGPDPARADAAEAGGPGAARAGTAGAVGAGGPGAARAGGLGEPGGGDGGGDGGAPPADDAEGRVAALASLAATVAACRRCRLAEGRNLTVPGAGDPLARLMFIGEGPGAEEDKRGLPFVGRAGELLTRIIEAIEMTREQVYIANIVKCRPPGNRDPQPDEVAACRPYLERQIAIIRPRVMVALGRIAAQTLLGTDLPIGRMRGQWFEIFGVPTMVTYHPAALLRNPALKRPTWEDMQQVRDRLRTTQ